MVEAGDRIPLDVVSSYQDNPNYWDDAAQTHFRNNGAPRALREFRSGAMMEAVRRRVLSGKAVGQFDLEGELIVFTPQKSSQP